MCDAADHLSGLRPPESTSGRSRLNTEVGDIISYCFSGINCTTSNWGGEKTEERTDVIVIFLLEMAYLNVSIFKLKSFIPIFYLVFHMGAGASIRLHDFVGFLYYVHTFLSPEIMATVAAFTNVSWRMRADALYRKRIFCFSPSGPINIDLKNVEQIPQDTRIFSSLVNMQWSGIWVQIFAPHHRSKWNLN